MRPTFKITLLSALAAVSVSLTVVLVSLRPVGAQVGALLPTSWTYWVAEDASLAVGALSHAGRFTYQDRVGFPGRVGDARANVEVKGTGRFPGMKLLDGALSHSEGQWGHKDGAMAYRAIHPPDPTSPYVKQNPFPLKLWTPLSLTDGPAIQVDGQGGTVFQPPPDDGRTQATRDDGLTSIKTTDKLGTDRLRARATMFGVSLKWDDRRAKIATTSAQLRAFLIQIRDAQREGRGEASMSFHGSLDEDQLATFLWLVRVRDGMPVNFKIGFVPTK